MSYNPYGGPGYPQYPAGGGYPGGVPQYPSAAPQYPAYGQAPPAGFNLNPNQQAPGFPRPGYPAATQPGYPAATQPGYPASTQPGYPSVPGQPPAGHQGYPAQPGGYPAQPAGYPGSQPAGYPGSQPAGYPGSQPAGYPTQPAGYPGSQPAGYPGSQPAGYPGSQPAGYPGSQPGGYPGQPRHPSSQPGGYPAQQPGGPPGSQHYPTSYPTQTAGPPAAKLGSAPGMVASGSDPFRPGNNWYRQKFSGTIRAAPTFDAAMDAHALRKAMKGLGTDEKAIIQVLCKRNNAQRQQISLQYKSGYGRDLIKDLKSELGGKFEDVILGLMMPPFEYLAQQLYKAMEGMGTDEDVLYETLCTHSNAEIRAIKDTYHRMYGRSLEQSVRSESSDYFKKLLTALIQANRDESGQVDPAKAANQAQALYKAGEKKMGTDEETFNIILVTQNPAQLHAIMAEYEKLSKKGFIKAIESETSGDYRQALMAIVKCALNRTAYFAERLRDTMKGMGTRDNDLIRLIVSRSEYDLANIKQEYLKLYGKTLEKDVASETSGDYKKALVMIVEGN